MPYTLDVHLFEIQICWIRHDTADSELRDL